MNFRKREPVSKAHPIFRLDDLTSQVENSELDLKLLLDKSQPGDLQPLDLLVETYGTELYRLAYALLDRPEEPAPDQMALDLCAQTLRIVLKNPNRFRSEERLHDWLFKSLVHVFRNRRKRDIWKLSNHRRTSTSRPVHSAPPINHSPSASQTEQERRLLVVLDSFDDRARLITVLHFVFNLDLHTISYISGFSPLVIQHNLNALRKAAYDNLLGAGYEWTAPPVDHKPHWGLMLTSLDGENELRASDRLRLQSHAESCLACRNYYADLGRLNDLLSQMLASRWGRQKLDVDGSSILTGRVRELLEKRKPRYRPPRLARLAAQLALLLVLFLGADWVIGNITGTTNIPEKLPPEQSTTAANSSLNSRGYPEERVLELGTTAGLFVNRFDFYLEPAISADGSWLAYAWNLKQTPATDNSDSKFEKSNTGLTLYGIKDERSIRVLPAPPGSLDIKGWPGDSGKADAVIHLIGGRVTSPGLSSDGRWLVFALLQEEDKISWNMKPCISPDNGCGVILLYDREVGVLELISKGTDDSLPNGAVLQPSITGDGSRILYWSNAANIVRDDGEYCSSAGEPPYNCWDLFVYDRERDTTERIPIGRRYEQLMWNDPVGLSYTGDYIALTIHRRDRIAQELDMNVVETDVYVLDFEGSIPQPVNQLADGSPGDGLSLLPVLSSDGRFAVFTTNSGNLDVRDTNSHFDVYLKDLYSGRVERISHAMGWRAGNSSSGLISMVDLINDKISRLGVSTDARYMVYLSTASNLSTVGTAWCAFYGYGRCGNLYVHDRDTGQTWPVFADPQRAGSYISPTVSPEGRWVMAVYQYETCSEPYGCAQIWLYDRENPTGWKKFNVDESGISAGKNEN